MKKIWRIQFHCKRLLGLFKSRRISFPDGHNQWLESALFQILIKMIRNNMFKTRILLLSMTRIRTIKRLKIFSQTI
jgi:hypothetical protein